MTFLRSEDIAYGIINVSAFILFSTFIEADADGAVWAVGVVRFIGTDMDTDVVAEVARFIGIDMAIDEVACWSISWTYFSHAVAS